MATLTALAGDSLLQLVQVERSSGLTEVSPSPGFYGFIMTLRGLCKVKSILVSDGIMTAWLLVAI